MNQLGRTKSEETLFEAWIPATSVLHAWD